MRISTAREILQKCQKAVTVSRYKFSKDVGIVIKGEFVATYREFVATYREFVAT